MIHHHHEVSYDYGPNWTPLSPTIKLFSCAVDSTVTYYSAPTRGTRRFSFDTFQFTGEYGSFVYLHCNLIVCNASKPTSRCSVNCLNLEFPRKKRATEEEKGVARAGLTEGPFILMREPEAGARDDYREKGTSLLQLIP